MYISKKKHIATESAIDTVTPREVMADKKESETPKTILPDTSGTGEGDGESQKSEIKNNGEIVVPQNPQDLGDGDIEDSAEETFSEFETKNTDRGILKIQASSGNSSIPFVNVNILVYKDFEDGRHTFFSGVTNADGIVSGIALPAPPKINSETGNGSPPYASYSVLATREGLIDETVENVPIFSGVVSIQPITMKSAGEV